MVKSKSRLSRVATCLMMVAVLIPSLGNTTFAEPMPVETTTQGYFISYSFSQPGLLPNYDSAGNAIPNMNDASVKIIFNTRLERAEVHLKGQVSNATRRTLRFEDTWVGEVFYLGFLIRSSITTVSPKGSYSAVCRATINPV